MMMATLPASFVLIFPSRFIVGLLLSFFCIDIFLLFLSVQVEIQNLSVGALGFFFGIKKADLLDRLRLVKS